MSLKTCNLCNKSSETEGIALIYFGEWMRKNDITVHYYCLLLSTHLPQRGEDHAGILGFLLRDIRQEIAMAKKRKCMYCFEMSATIQCDKCKNNFHLTCGHTSKCLSQFDGEFKSYCHACIPIDDIQEEIFKRKPPQGNEICYICTQIMGPNPKRWIYAKCCGNGFTHSKCMKMYALSAGYYLTCIWCKDKSFRKDIKYQGVFVPDREANWEREKGAFKELYQGHRRCDMETCNCPKGRDYSNSFKWQLIICKLCGAFGAHNPACIPGFEGSKEKVNEFKCDICSVTEQTVLHKTMAGTVNCLIDTSLYVNKDLTTAPPPSQPLQSLHSEIYDSSVDSTSSQDTIVNVNILKNYTTPSTKNVFENTNETTTYQIASAIYTLTESPEINLNNQQIDPEVINDMDTDSDDSTVADLLVQRMLNVFNV